MDELSTITSYKSILDPKHTQSAVKFIKDNFGFCLSSALKLKKVTAPLFVRKDTGINDDLTGIENKVTFKARSLGNVKLEIVNSLAKWKRQALFDYGFLTGSGIYTDMKAIRPDEEVDNLHSLYVDQWDWELVMSKDERNFKFLETVVSKIYRSIRRVEALVSKRYKLIETLLPSKIKFIHAEDLRKKYPLLTPREREIEFTKKHKAVFIIGIGASLGDGIPHDKRAPDYDDWTTVNEAGFKGLNGDILVWHPILNTAVELSSMGIRVNSKSMLRQLKLTSSLKKRRLLFHEKIINDELPLSIGGGIGQSRLCMYLLRKVHIGEVQCSVWPAEILAECKRVGIKLL